ncbi:MAG TPA: putative sulfate exporter family transporter [Conexibacter sp.]|nr:putative sulfate exporter family transporter [Conexibacter sp.]
MAHADHSHAYRASRRFDVALAPAALALAGIVGASFALAAVVPAATPALGAMALAMLAAPAVRRLPGALAVARLASGSLLRAGVALLGLRVATGDIAALGLAGVALACITVLVTLGGTVWVARRLQVQQGLALLIGAGSAICGASAIAAVASATDGEEEDVGYAVATVTVLGTASMLAVPLVATLLGLSPCDAGLWAGASIQEVAGVAGAGAAIGPAALTVATIVKLTRVLLLAPVVALLASGRAGRGAVCIPGFVIAFVAFAALRAVAAPPAALLDVAGVASAVLLATGLAGLGLKIDAAALRGAGVRPLLLGLAGALLAAGSSLLVVLAV